MIKLARAGQIVLSRTRKETDKMDGAVTAW
jgi:hypothetical protein